MYQLGKANMVADGFNKVYMGNIAHVEDAKKKLVKQVYCLDLLGVRLNSSRKGGVLAINGGGIIFSSGG